MADGNIDIDIKLDSSKAKTQASKLGDDLGKKVQAGVDKASQTAKKSTSQAMGEIGQSVTNYGNKMSKAVTIPILAAATATGAAAVKIDTALTGVRKTLDASEEQYEALKDAAIEFSKTNAVDPAQILDIQALGAQLGYGAESLQLFGETISGLSLSTDLGAEEAATAIAQMSNIMNSSKDDTDRYGSAIVDLGNHYATTESKITNMSMRIAAAGKQIGMSEADVLGMATALSSMGIEAEAGGTAISTIMSNIDKAVATNSDKLSIWAEAAGMSAETFANAWKKDPVDALSAVLKGMDKATQEGGNMSVMLEELGINAIRQTDTLKRLANNAEMLPKAVLTANEAWESNTALTKEVENRNASMAAQLEILFNKVQAIAIEVGEPLMNALLDIIDSAQPLIDALASGAKAFGDLDEGGQRLILTVIGIAAAFGPATSILGKLITGAQNNSKAWSEFAANIKTVYANIKQSATATTKASSALEKYRVVQRGTQKVVYKLDETTGSYVKTNSKLQTAIKGSTAATNLQTKAIKLGTVAMNAAKGAAKTLKSAMLSMAPMVIIAVIAKIASVIGEVREKAEKTKKATDGLRDSFNSYKDAYSTASRDMQAAANSTDNYRKSLSELTEAYDDTIEKQAELADKLDELWSETGTNNAMVDEYMGTIEELTNKYDDQGNKIKLTKDEQVKLQEAVSGLNSVMGTTYSIIDSENGILNESTDVIRANAQAWQDRALAAAESEETAELMKVHIENQQKIAEADKEAKRAKQDYDAALKRHDSNLMLYYDTMELTEKEVTKLKDADQATVDKMNQLHDTIAQVSDSFKSSADAISNYINATSEWGDAIEKSEVDIDDFSGTLEELGISTDVLAQVMKEKGADGINGFIEAYKGGKDDLLSWIKSNGFSDVAEAASESSVTLEDAWRGAGSAAMGALNRGIESKAGDAKESGQYVATVALEGAESVDFAPSGEASGDEYGSGIVDASGNIKADAKAAASSAKGGFTAFNDEASTWGNDLGINFGQGIRKAIDAITGAASWVMEKVKSIMGFSVPKDGVWSGAEKGGERSGRHLVENFAQGMRNATPDAVQASQDAMDEIREPFLELSDFMSNDLIGELDTSLAQIESSIGRGISIPNLIAQGGGTTNNSTVWNINQPIATPDELMRQARLQQLYGLAGSR